MGHAYPLEMHFVHFACEFGTIEEAATRGEETGGKGSADHTLAVVGLFFEISEEDNPVFEFMFNEDIKDEIDTGCKAGVHMQPDKPLFEYLLPDNWQEGGYYAY